MVFSDRFKRIFKPRFAIFYPLAVFMLVFGVCDEGSLRAGIGYIIAGFLLRLWSNGYAIKNNKLTTSGPYAFVRNPLYVGTFLILLGSVITVEMGWIGVGFVALLGLMYYKTIGEEERTLLGYYGEEYRKYLNKVPSIIPTLVPYTEGEKWPFSLQRLIDSKEHKPVFWMIVLLIFFHVKSRVWIEGKPMTEKTWALTAFALLLITLDIIYEFNKKKIHQK